MSIPAEFTKQQCHLFVVVRAWVCIITVTSRLRQSWQQTENAVIRVSMN